MEISKKFFLIIALIFIALILIGVIYYFYLERPINYLILGVPYNGMEKLFFRNANSGRVASMLDILGYWGDERFNINNIEGWQPRLYSATTPAIVSVKNFLESNGYESALISPRAGTEIKEIKKFVNSDKKIPVIVYQKRWLNSESPSYVLRVVIGVFDKDKKVIVHDNNFGNNFEISYSDFEQLFIDNARSILAVWPSDELGKNIKGPDYNVSYPPRTEAMKNFAPILATRFSDANTFRFEQKNFEKARDAYQQLAYDENFKYFPRALQVVLLSSYADMSANTGRSTKAIKVIVEWVLPINQNLSEAPKEWYVPSVDKSPYPYYVLSKAYYAKGNKGLAISYYKEMLSIRDLNYKDGEREFFSVLCIPSLEEELVSIDKRWCSKK